MVEEGTPDAGGREPFGRLSRAKKILVVGCGGAGKSTFASELGSALGIRVVHLDRLYWRPGWVEPSPEEWSGTVRRLVAEQTWVMDGNYGGTLDPRLAEADAVVFVDFPRLLCLWRVIRRRLTYRRRTRPDMAPGCPERLTPGFLKYIWSYPSKRRPGVLEKLRRFAASGGEAVVLRSPGEVRWFLYSLKARTAVPHRAVNR